MCVCVCVCVCARMCVHVCVCGCIHVCMHACIDGCLDINYTVKPVLSAHAWAKKKWSLNRGSLLIEVKIHRKATIGT